MSNDAYKPVFETALDDYNAMVSGAAKAPAQPSYYQRPSSAAGGGFSVGGAEESGSEFGKGFGRSFAEIPGLVAGLGAYAADVVGADGARDAMLKFAKEREESVQQSYGSDNASFTSVLEGKGDPWKFLQNASGYVTGQAIQSIATAGGGSLLAKAFLKSGAAAAGERFAADQIAKGVAPAAAQKATEEFLKGEAKRIGLAGAGAGMGAQNLAMEVGSIYPDAVDQAQKEGRQLDGGDLARVGIAGAGAAAVETAMDKFNLGKVLGGSKAGGSLPARAAREIPAGMARESTTEGIQTGLERFGAGQSLNDANAWRDYLDSMAVGAIGGGQAGALTSLHKADAQPTPQPNPLQTVIDQAQKPGSVLSRAVVSTGVTEQTVAPGATPIDTQNAATDPLSQRVRNIEAGMSNAGWLDNLRDDGVNTNELLRDLALARNPNNPAGSRAAALERVETAIHFANQVAEPRPAMDSIQNNPAFDFTQQEQVEPQEIPDLTAVATALRDPNLRNTVSDEDRNQLLYLYNIAQNSQGDQVVRTNAARQALEIVGRYQAPAGTPTSTMPALEQAAPASAPIAAPAEQQNVASTPKELDFLQDAAAPQVTSIPAGEGPAFLRKRAAVVQQLVGNGFETVQRDGKDFYLTNTKTGQKFKLDGPADAQLARKAIKDRVDELAHTAAASPNNERTEPTQAQIEAGNYKKSDVIELNGMKIKIENPQGSIRRGIGADGKAWETKMAHHYGEFQGTIGADGDKLDVFVGPRPDSHKIYVIDQVNKDGSFDEHKVMMGFTSEDDARQGYLANYDAGWTGLGAITEMSPEEFKTWAHSRKAKKPAAVLEKAAAAPAENFTEAEKAEEPKKTGFLYLNDGGKKRELRLIKPGELPKGASAKREGKYRAITQGEASMLQAIAGALGKNVVFYEAQGGRLSDGFVMPSNSNTIYLATETTVNPLAVFGHEFFHTLRDTNPAAWNAIAAVVRSKVSNAKGFREDYFGDKVAAERGDAALTDEHGGELEELVSDLGGNLLKDSKFWGEVFDKIKADNPEEAKSIIAKLSAAVERIIKRVVKAMNQPGYRADQFVKDLDEVRAAFADGMAQYLKESGVTQRAMAAEKLKAEQKIKKSEDRPDGLTLTGYHFSQQPRQMLSSATHGAGLQDANREQFQNAADERLRDRIYFYVDKGTGITPLPGLGTHAHRATLTNVYDMNEDPLGLRKGKSLEAFESAVLDAGYDGYLDRRQGTQPGVVIMLGKRSIKPEYLGQMGSIQNGEKIPGAEAPEVKEEPIKKGLMSKELNAINVDAIPGATLRSGMLTVPVESREQANAELERIGSSLRLSPERETDEERAKREYAEVEAKYKGTDQWLKAPDGSATELNERQWVQVRTPSFKNWFGDWEKFAGMRGGVWNDSKKEVSKVVGKNGEPLVVYHGTNKGGFSEFNQPSGNRRGDLGIFTTPNLEMAQTYYSRRGGEIDLSGKTQAELQDLGYEFKPGFIIKGTNDSFFESKEELLNEFELDPGEEIVEAWDVTDPNGYSVDGPRDHSYYFASLKDAIDTINLESNLGANESGYYAMFANIRNPNETDFEGANWEGSREGQYNVVDENGDQVYDENGKGVFDDYEEAQAVQFAHPGTTVEGAADHHQTTDDVVFEAIDFGFDGAYMQNVVDAGPGGGAYIDEPSDIFVALNPGQLKSANFNNGAFNVSSDDLRFSPERKAIPESVDEVTNVDAAFKFAQSRVFATNRDFKLELQKRALDAAKAARVPLDERDERTENYLVRVGELDARSGLRDNSNAVGWYNEKVSKALAILSLIHPEIKTNPEARFAFTWALAVTSNGQKVGKNFELAEMVYQIYKDTGRMPTDIKAGQTQGPINDALGMFNDLRKAWGMQGLMDFMVNMDTVKSIQASSGVDISGEGMNTEVYGAAILGPKIGNGFFMNLYGQFDQLTMDRWLMRTWGRWTGTLVENDRKNIKISRERLTNLVRLLDAPQRKEFEQVIGARLSVSKIDELAKTIQKASAKPKLRERMNEIGELSPELRDQLDEILGEAKKNAKRDSLGGELRKLGNNLAKYLDGQKEAPAGSKERDFIRKVFGRVLANLKTEMPDITMADLQAVLWYPEKRLYDAAKADDQSVESGYADDEAPDYANAAADLAAQKGVSADKIAQVTKEIDDEIAANKRARDAGRSDSESLEAGETAGAEAAGGTESSGLQEPERVRGSSERVATAGGQDQGSRRREKDGSLNGLPRDFTVDGKKITASHWAPAEDVARQYMDDAGLPYNPPAQYVKVDPKRATRIAAEYEKLKHDPQNPEVKAAYAALVKETAAQYQAVVDSGLKVEFIDFAKQGDPYAASPRLMTEDVRRNNHMYVFSTRDGFGSDAEFDPVDNPLLAETEFEISGKKALVNDLFRVVHDYFGHVKEGVGFRADGEENTWRAHSAMFSPLAQRALTTETRGQNSWVNYGPQGEKNRTASAGDTHYADQKVGLLPLWVSEDGRGDGPGPNGGIKMSPERSVINLINRAGAAAKSEGDVNAVLRDTESQVLALSDAQVLALDRLETELAKVTNRLNAMSDSPERRALAVIVDKIDLEIDDAVNAGTLLELTGQDGRNAEGLLRELQSAGAIRKSPERPHFYSQLQRAIGEVPQRLATMAAPAWKQWLTANASKLGVKADEIEWSGIKDYLDLQGKNKLSKDDLVAYLDDSGVKVRDVVLEGPEATGDLEIIESDDGTYRIVDDAGVQYGGDFESYSVADMIMADLTEGGTKYGQYTLPGGENYRELLITLPGEEEARNKRFHEIADEMRNATPERYAELHAERSRLYDEHQSGYESSHWDQKNILAHIRVNDRIDADGKRVLFVEEVQSDWGQEGKKKGFNTPLKTEGWTAKRGEGDLASGPVWEVRNAQGGWVLGIPVANVPTAEAAIERAARNGDAHRGGNQGSVPSAPFVTKTEGWLNLALKRIAMMAVEGGYDKVAFVNGEQSADRYSLEKHVDSITYEPTYKGYYINVMAGGSNIKNGEFTASELEDIVGKEIVQKMEAREGKVVGTPGAPDYEDLKHVRTLSGEGLKVGGEGMKTFYDKLVPQALNKLLPKLGGEKLSNVELVRRQEGGFRGIPGITPMQKFDAAETRLQQPGFDVTDKMRETVGQGVPLFSRDRVVPDFVTDDDRGKDVLYAEFDGGSAYVQYVGDNKGNLHLLSINTEGSETVRGRDILNWLSYTYQRPIVVNEVASTARTYWNQMEDEGLIKDWSEDDYNGKTEPLNEILKSSDRPYFDDLSKLKITTNYQLGDLLKTSKKLSWWDRTIGTQYNLAQKHPQFKRVFDAVQRFIGDVSAYATRAADLAPTILPKLETWKDIGKAPLSAEDVKALRDPIFGGTLNYTRDEEGNLVETEDVSTAGVVFTNEELRDKFGLDDRQIGLYREFRKATNKSLSDLAVSDMLRYLGTDGEGVRQRALDASNLDGALNAMVAHLDQLIEQQPERAKVLEDSKKAIKEKAGQAIGLMARGYAPLSRFGQYTVYVVGNDGEQIYFSMFEEDRDAQKMAREMQEQYPDATVTTGTMSQESYKLFSGVTPETLALFGESLGMEESGVDAKSEVFQQYLKMAKTNRSAMKRLIQRKGIDGFSEDAGRVLAGFVYSNARQISTNLHAGEIGRSASAVTDGDVKDAAIRLMEYVQNPREEAQALRGLMFTNFIGGSIASAMVNLTQPFTMTLPYLSQFDGAGGAAARMADAVKLVSRGIRNDDELKAALKKAEDEGVVSPQEVHQLMAQAQGKGALKSGDGTKAGDAAAKVNNAMAKLGLGWGKVFSAAEQFNRRVTFIAAYKLAREQGMADPMAFAAQAISETQGVYNKGNKPTWARGAVGSTLFTFKQYSIGYIEFLRRMWGNGPEGKKAVGLALGVLFLMAGVGGMPGADDLDDIIDGLMQRVLGRSFDSKQAKREFFASILGQSGAEFVMSGLSGLPGMPIDVSGRMSLGNLIPGTGLLTKKRDYGRDYLEITGPAGTLFTNAGAAIANIAAGEYRKAIESAAPTAVQNVAKSIDMAQMGFYRDAKGRKVVDVDAYDVMAKAIGFQPRAVAQVQEATGTQANLITQNKLRETEIADKWAQGKIENNMRKIAEARKELADWNRDNPESPIKIDPSQIQKRVKEANKTKTERVAATAPKELRGAVKRELERETQ